MQNSNCNIGDILLFLAGACDQILLWKTGPKEKEVITLIWRSLHSDLAETVEPLLNSLFSLPNSRSLLESVYLYDSHTLRKERFTLPPDWISFVTVGIKKRLHFVIWHLSDGFLTFWSKSAAIRTILTDLFLWKQCGDSEAEVAHGSFRDDSDSSYAAALKRHSGLREGQPQKSEWSIAITCL